MRRLSPRVNVIPVIGKSDTLTPGELQDFKRRVMEDIEYYNIPVYNFPFDAEEDDEETIADNSELRAMMPFAIVGSEEEVEVNGEPVRARRYPWGIVEVDNPQHSDFQRLRHSLLVTHLTDLKEITVRLDIARRPEVKALTFPPFPLLDLSSPSLCLSTLARLLGHLQ